jgi:hypothetical protein
MKLKNVCCGSILRYLFLTFTFFFFIKSSYIYLKFQYVSSAKSKTKIVITVLLVTVHVRKGSTTKSLNVQYEKLYILASAPPLYVYSQDNELTPAILSILTLRVVMCVCAFVPPPECHSFSSGSVFLPHGLRFRS